MTAPHNDEAARDLRDPAEFELCRACGAYDVADQGGRCNYCGASLPSTWLDY